NLRDRDHPFQGFEPIPISHVLEIDDEGTMYLVWVGFNERLHVAYSEDKGKSWSDPIRVTPKSVTSAIHPSIAVKENGHIAVSYVGSKDRSMYNAYLAEIPDVFADNPTIHTGQVTTSENPVSRTGCCWKTRHLDGLYEQTGVDFAPDGTLWAGYVRQHETKTGHWEGTVGKMTTGGGEQPR
ncbi:MAG: sialidase family protein, partial [Halobacteria archaeon]|nr:sialidase family protein [Halobacteria archaeon]